MLCCLICFFPGCWRQLYWSAGILHGSVSHNASGRDGPQSQSGGKCERAGRWHTGVLPLQSRSLSRTVLRAAYLQTGILSKRIIQNKQLFEGFTQAEYDFNGSINGACKVTSLPPYSFNCKLWPSFVTLSLYRASFIELQRINQISQTAQWQVLYHISGCTTLTRTP